MAPLRLCPFGLLCTNVHVCMHLSFSPVFLSLPTCPPLSLSVWSQSLWWAQQQVPSREDTEASLLRLPVPLPFPHPPPPPLSRKYSPSLLHPQMSQNVAVHRRNVPGNRPGRSWQPSSWRRQRGSLSQDTSDTEEQ